MAVRCDIMRRGMRKHTAWFSERCALVREISKIPTLTVEFTSPTRLSIERGDYVMIGGDKFLFIVEPTEEMTSRGEFKYTGEMKGVESCLETTLFLFLDENAQRTTIYSESTEFDLTATFAEFLSMIVRNLDRVGVEWTYEVSGADFDASETKNLSFSGQSCLSALESVCEEYEAEWRLEGGILKVARKYEEKTGITLSYPENLTSPVRVSHEDDEYTCTRLFVFGGERNIPTGYNGGKSKRLLMDGFQESLNRDGARFAIEKVKIFDEIYPRRTGKVGSVIVNANGIHYIVDNSIEFNINALLTGNTAKIAFKSGNLVGYEFEIASYNNTAKTIEIKQQTEGGIVIPNETMKAKRGDEYVLLDINMPTSYLRDAEKELRREATRFFAEECGDKLSADANVSTIWMLENNVTFRPFHLVKLKADELGIDREIRVVKTTSHPFDDGSHTRKQEIKLSDFVKKSRMEGMENRIETGARTANSRFLRLRNNVNSASADVNINRELLEWNF